MTLDEYQKSLDLARLTSAWRRLTPWQKLDLYLHALSHLGLVALNRHIQRRQAEFERPRVHWVR